LLTYHEGVSDSSDALFRALNDRSRRVLLDTLREQDGQTLGELCTQLPQMTRYGVMNHLRVLEEGGLIATHKAGRKKYHYLNVVPLQELHQRWLTKFTEPVSATLSSLKANLEQGDRTMTRPIHIHETFIVADPSEVWQAITKGTATAQYFYGTSVESDWIAGEPIRYLSTDGQESVVADGRLITVDEPNQLAMTFHPRWDPELEAEGPVHMTWLIDRAGDGISRVRVEYREMDPDGKIAEAFVPGIAYIMAGLKTLVETGKPMPA